MWLIIGYGNPLRGDDGAGPIFVEQLRTKLAPDFARIITVHQLTPELALELSRPEITRALFVDVKRQQHSAAEILPLPKDSVQSSFGHQLQPDILLHSAEHLYGRPLPGWLLTLPGRDFSFSEQLSSTTSDAFESALEACLSFLRSDTARSQLPQNN